MKSIISIFFITFFQFTLFAQIPNGYYDSAIGLEGDALREELRAIITSGHTSNTYKSGKDLHDDFEFTDKKSNGKVWDMYSDIPGETPPYEYDFVSGDQCGSYGGEGDCYNREHSFPKSWFGGSGQPQYADLFHLVPTDGYVNGMRSSLPYGENNGEDWTSQNGSKKGNCTYPGYTGTCFEPIDGYKGDFARNYFYMATRYKNSFSGWNSPMLSGDNYTVWATNLLLEWHQNDPVSQKEINRNNAVHDIQHNRNPFIDYPEWVECIWTGSCGVQNPDNYTASASSETQIDLSWTLNDDNDDVVLAYNTTNTFGTPSGTYTVGQTISGGGEVLYVGNLTSFNHQSLTSQTYYYKIWSVDGSTEYSSGIETNATPLMSEPSNNVTNFIVSNETANTISLTWNDATGGQLPDAYLIKASTGGITPPVDGNPEADAQFVKNVSYGNETVTFSGLTPSTTYFFEIYPYTNSGNYINYKTNSVESAIGNTIAGATILFFGSFETGYEGWTFYNNGGAPDWERTTDGGSYSPGDDGHDGTYYMWYYGWNGNADDWLISPELDFSGYTDAKFKFWSWMRNSANGNLTMKVSTNYPGSGNPASYTWTDFSPNFASSEFQWTNSGEVDLSAYDNQTCYVAFYYSGTDVDRNWAIDDITVSATSTTSNDNDSEANNPASQISGTSISSLADTEAEAVDVFSFTIEDKGTSDGLKTQVYNIRIYPAASNTADWSYSIQGVKLSDGNNISISSLSVNNSYINMMISPVDIDDASSKTFTMSIWLYPEYITDGSVFSFKIDADNHGFVADNQFSTFATVFNGGSDIVSSDFVIDVEATGINFSQQPEDTPVDVVISPAVEIEAVDENGNIDIDFNTAVTISSSGTMTGDPISGTWSSGISSFSGIIHTEIGEDIQLTANSGSFSVLSDLFDIYCMPVDVSKLL